MSSFNIHENCGRQTYTFYSSMLLLYTESFFMKAVYKLSDHPSWSAQTFPGLALNIPHLRKPFGPGETRTVGHYTYANLLPVSSLFFLHLFNFFIFLLLFLSFFLLLYLLLLLLLPLLFLLLSSLSFSFFLSFFFHPIQLFNQVFKKKAKKNQFQMLGINKTHLQNRNSRFHN